MYEKLVAKMKEQNVTFGDLANQLTVSKQTLTKKMKGTLDFTYEEIMTISKILQISEPIDFFF